MAKAVVDLPLSQSRVRAGFDAKWLVIGAAVLAVAWLALVPSGFLVIQSFMTPFGGDMPARATLMNYVHVYTNPETLRLLTNSVLFSGGAASLSLVLGTGLAFINERTNAGFRALIYALSVVPLVVPGVLFVTAWIMLASPKIGIINLALQGAFGTDAVFVNVYSLLGMIWVDGIQHAPIAFLLMSAALKAMDPALEEQALLSGATVLQTVRRVTLRLALPALVASFLILFLRSIESFENPALLGLPAGIDVFTSAIYEALRAYPSDVGLASTYAVTLLLIVTGGLYGQTRFARNATRYATITGKAFRLRRMDVGAWRLPICFGIFLYAALVIGLPFLVLVWSSLQPFYSVPSWQALQSVSLANYEAVFEYPNIGSAIWNSVLLSAGCATLVMALSAVIAWTVLKTKVPGRHTLDVMASLPMVMPGLVVGLAIMICYIALFSGLYGTVWILLIAYLTRFFPYGMRFNTASLIGLHKELEESASLAGAGWLTVFRRIVMPLIAPGMLAGWIYIVVVSLRELSSSVLLYSPDSEVVSVVLWEMWQNGQYVQLSALGVMMIAVLFVFVLLAQFFSRRFGLNEV